MADGSRLRAWLIGGASVVVVAALVFAVLGYREQRDADLRLDHARAALVTGRAPADGADANVAAAISTVTKLAPQISAILQRADAAAKLDAQESALLQQAVQAGIAGDAGAFNQAVGQRNALNAPHDAALDGLRAPADALFAGLDGIATTG